MFDIPVTTVMKEGRQDYSTALAITHQISKLLYMNRDAKPGHDELVYVANTLQEELQLTLSTEQINAILSLYPHARIKLALDGLDTEPMGLVMDAFAHFFLGCSWPKYGDIQHGEPVEGADKLVDMDEFRALLKKQAKTMGFVHG